MITARPVERKSGRKRVYRSEFLQSSQNRAWIRAAVHIAGFAFLVKLTLPPSFRSSVWHTRPQIPPNYMVDAVSWPASRQTTRPLAAWFPLVLLRSVRCANMFVR